jgi:hypothetical protein
MTGTGEMPKGMDNDSICSYAIFRQFVTLSTITVSCIIAVPIQNSSGHYHAILRHPRFKFNLVFQVSSFRSFSFSLVCQKSELPLLSTTPSMHDRLLVISHFSSATPRRMVPDAHARPSCSLHFHNRQQCRVPSQLSPVASLHAMFCVAARCVPRPTG